MTSDYRNILKALEKTFKAEANVNHYNNNFWKKDNISDLDKARKIFYIKLKEAKDSNNNLDQDCLINFLKIEIGNEELSFESSKNHLIDQIFALLDEKSKKRIFIEKELTKGNIPLINSILKTQKCEGKIFEEYLNSIKDAKLRENKAFNWIGYGKNNLRILDLILGSAINSNVNKHSIKPKIKDSFFGNATHSNILSYIVNIENNSIIERFWDEIKTPENMNKIFIELKNNLESSPNRARNILRIYNKPYNLFTIEGNAQKVWQIREIRSRLKEKNWNVLQINQIKDIINIFSSDINNKIGIIAVSKDFITQLGLSNKIPYEIALIITCEFVKDQFQEKTGNNLLIDSNKIEAIYYSIGSNCEGGISKDIYNYRQYSHTYKATKEVKTIEAPNYESKISNQNRSSSVKRLNF